MLLQSSNQFIVSFLVTKDKLASKFEWVDKRAIAEALEISDMQILFE